MDFDKLDARANEVLDEMGNVKPGSPEREKLVNELTAISKVVDDAEKRDANRINSYTQNDINQQRIEIDEERIKTDRANSKRDFWGRIIHTAVTSAVSVGLAIVSFKGEWLMNVLKDRTIWDIAKSLKPRS